MPESSRSIRLAAGTLIANAPAVDWTFRDRAQAGRGLAAELADLEGRTDLVVVALLSGGAPIGFEVARALHAPLDVYGVARLSAPGREELALGVIGERGSVVLDPEVASELGPEVVERAVRRSRRALGGARLPALPVRDRTVIVVDDGMQTGASMTAAVRALRAERPHRIVVAVPVASADSIAALRQEADEVVCSAVPTPFEGLGTYYSDYRRVDDATARQLVERANRPRGNGLGTAGRDVSFAGGSGQGTLRLPKPAFGVVICVNGASSAASALEDAGIATLALESADAILAAIEWCSQSAEVGSLPLGLLTFATGATEAVRIAAVRPDVIRALVYRSCRFDSTDGDVLSRVLSPTLLVLGARDEAAIAASREATRLLRCPNRIELVRGASCDFSEPGTMREVERLASEWFLHYF